MTAYLRDVAALGWPIAVGLPIALTVQPLQSLIPRIGLAFLTGSAAGGIVFIVLGIAGLPFRTEWLGLVVIAWLVGWGWVMRRRLLRLRPSATARRPVIDPVVALLLALTILSLVTAAWYALATPVGISDVLSIWLPKADAMARHHSLLALNRTTFPEYPPWWPVQLFITRAIAGHDNAVKLLPTLYLASLLAVIYGYLSIRTRPVIAATTVWVLASIPYFWVPYGVNDLMAEVPYTALLIAAVVGLVRYIEDDDVRQLAGSVLLATAFALVRPEGFQVAVLMGILAAVFTRRRRRPWLLALTGVLLPVLAYGIWVVAIRLAPHGARGYGVAAGRVLGLITPHAVATVISYTVHWLANPFVFGPTVIAAALCIVGYRSWRSTWPWLAIFALDLAAIGATYLIAPASNDQPLSWWLATGFKRMLLHIVPLLFIAAAVVVSGWWRPTAEVSVPAEGEQGTSRKVGSLVAAAAMIAAAVLTVVAAGPGTVLIASLVPNGVVGLPVPVTVGRQTPAGWVDDARAGADSILLAVAAASRGGVTYDLHNLGERLPPNDAVYGRFTSVDAEAGSSFYAPGTEVQLGANDRALVSARLGADPVTPASLRAAIPPDARTVSVVVNPAPDSLAGQRVWVRAQLHRGGAWPVVAGLLLLAGVVAIALVLGGGLTATHQWAGRGAGLVVALLLFAGLVQQLDVLTNQALPLWSQAAHTVVHQLRSH